MDFVSDVSPEITGVFFSGETSEKEETSEEVFICSPFKDFM